MRPLRLGLAMFGALLLSAFSMQVSDAAPQQKKTKSQASQNDKAPSQDNAEDPRSTLIAKQKECVATMVRNDPPTELFGQKDELLKKAVSNIGVKIELPQTGTELKITSMVEILALKFSTKEILEIADKFCKEWDRIGRPALICVLFSVWLGEIVKTVKITMHIAEWFNILLYTYDALQNRAFQQAQRQILQQAQQQMIQQANTH